MKRRIVCDRTEPECSKCLKKSLTCPGLGIRYRFNDGMASRGKLRGRTYEVLDPAPSPSPFPTSIIWIPNFGLETLGEIKGSEDNGITSATVIGAQGVGRDHARPLSDMVDDVDEIGQCPILMPGLDLMDAKTRYLFYHCS